MKQQLALEAKNLVKHLQQVSQHGVVQMDRVFDVAVLNSLWFMFAGHRFEYNDEKLQEVLAIVHEAFRQAIIDQYRTLCMRVYLLHRVVVCLSYRVIRVNATA